MDFDLVVLFEHPEGQKPLFSALDRRGVRYGAFDLKHGPSIPIVSQTRRCTSTRRLASKIDANQRSQN